MGQAVLCPHGLSIIYEVSILKGLFEVDYSGILRCASFRMVYLKRFYNKSARSDLTQGVVRMNQA